MVLFFGPTCVTSTNLKHEDFSLWGNSSRGLKESSWEKKGIITSSEPCGPVRTAFSVVTKERNVCHQLDVICMHYERCIKWHVFNALKTASKRLWGSLLCHTNSFTCRPISLERNAPNESFLHFQLGSVKTCVSIKL